MTATTLLTLCAMFFYGAATFSALRLIQNPQNTSATSLWMLLGLMSHGVLIYLLTSPAQGIAFHLGHALIWVSGLTMMVLLVLFFTHKIALMTLILGPATMVALGFSLLHSGANAHIVAWSLGSHILSSVLAYVLFGFAAAQALLYAYQERHLHQHQITAIVRSLPPLKTMENLLFNFIKLGFIVLTMALLSGFFFLEDLFAQHLAHKTFFSILSWFVFIGLLMGRHGAGWRGKTAVRWTLVGYLLLAMGFVGSRFVLERFIL